MKSNKYRIHSLIQNITQVIYLPETILILYI